MVKMPILSTNPELHVALENTLLLLSYSSLGSHCLKVRVLTIFVMSFSPPAVGCLLKKVYKEGGTRVPQDPPVYAPELTTK